MNNDCNENNLPWFDIWVEGYESGYGPVPGYKFLTSFGTDFDDAVQRRKDRLKDFDSLYKNENGEWEFMGCKLYDNREDASKYGVIEDMFDEFHNRNK